MVCGRIRSTVTSATCIWRPFFELFQICFSKAQSTFPMRPSSSIWWSWTLWVHVHHIPVLHSPSHFPAFACHCIHGYSSSCYLLKERENIMEDRASLCKIFLLFRTKAWLRRGDSGDWGGDVGECSSVTGADYGGWWEPPHSQQLPDKSRLWSSLQLQEMLLFHCPESSHTHLGEPLSKLYLRLNKNSSLFLLNMSLLLE